MEFRLAGPLVSAIRTTAVELFIRTQSVTNKDFFLYYTYSQTQLYFY